MTYQDLENSRKKYRNFLLRILFLNLFVCILTIVSFHIAIAQPFSLSPVAADLLLHASVILTIAWAAIAIFSIIFLIHNRHKVNYRAAYKAYFVQTALPQFFSDLTYNQEGGVASEAVYRTGIIKMGDKFETNDYIAGQYRDVPFSQSDIRIRRKTLETEDNTYYHTTFRARWITFDFNRKLISRRVVVVGKKFKGLHLPKGQNYRKVEVESSLFNQHFDLYTQGELEAFFLLDPAFIDKINQLDQRHHGKILLYFSPTSIQIATQDRKDILEPPHPFKAIDAQAEATKVLTDIHAITNIIDTLKLQKKDNVS